MSCWLYRKKSDSFQKIIFRWEHLGAHHSAMTSYRCAKLCWNLFWNGDHLEGRKPICVESSWSLCVCSVTWPNRSTFRSFPVCVGWWLFLRAKNVKNTRGLVSKSTHPRPWNYKTIASKNPATNWNVWAPTCPTSPWRNELLKHSPGTTPGPYIPRSSNYATCLPFHPKKEHPTGKHVA